MGCNFCDDCSECTAGCGIGCGGWEPTEQNGGLRHSCDDWYDYDYDYEYDNYRDEARMGEEEKIDGESDRRYCVHCGRRVEKSWNYCLRCGTEIPPGIKTLSFMTGSIAKRSTEGSKVVNISDWIRKPKADRTGQPVWAIERETGEIKRDKSGNPIQAFGPAYLEIEFEDGCLFRIDASSLPHLAEEVDLSIVYAGSPAIIKAWRDADGQPHIRLLEDSSDSTPTPTPPPRQNAHDDELPF